MQYFRAWYRSEGEAGALNPSYPDWVVHAMDEDDAISKVLGALHRATPERHYRVFLLAIADEDEATIAYATARQNGQALS
ncbi:MAG TPA: hypothetical protein VGM37_15610 [Armatimonadota bacterium]